HHHADHSVVSSLHFAYTASSSTRVCLLSLHDALPIFIYLFPYLPKIGRVIPSPLVCILVLTAIAMYFGVDIRTVGDMGELPDTLPVFLLPDVPLNFETLAIIFPYSAALAVVGLLESMMTATIVD